ncbi:MAG: hypothetical protein ACJAT2_003562 [Bacteriovoracaceae bacterium]|jgi:hypothetical protein
MKGHLILSALLLLSLNLSAEDIVKVDKYMGSCEIEDSKLKAHFSYISETGYLDGYSNKGIRIQFADAEGYLTRLSHEVKILDLTGFEKDVKVKNSWNKFEVEKSGNLFGGVAAELKLSKIRKSGKINYEYKCYSGSKCGEYHVDLEFYGCDLDYRFNGKRLK